MTTPRCFVCSAGPKGLRGYSFERVKGKLVAVTWVCAEWLVPCFKRRNAFGRKVRAKGRS
jgi:hypothetical protein